jgi:SAM-dependent methyltransferase
MYQHIARYYDLLHDELVEDVEFLSKLAEEAGDPVLEVGCGTGRVLLPLARSGHRVVGVDVSEEMLQIARTKLANEEADVQNRARLEYGDFNEVSLDRRFRLAIIAYNTLMHMGPVALAFCLGNIRQHLAQGAALFIDVDNPVEVHDPGQDGLLLLDRTIIDEARDEVITLSVSSLGDGESQTRDTVWIVDASPVQGGSVRRTVARSTLHYYFAHQLDQILETAGFALVGQYGDYDQRPYRADESRRLLLLAAAR